MSIIGAVAVMLVAGWCIYNFFVGWPWRYEGGILYDRMVRDHVVASLLRGAGFLALPLLALFYQVFGYDLIVGTSSAPRRRKLGNAMFFAATAAAAGIALVAGGALFLQVVMETVPH